MMSLTDKVKCLFVFGTRPEAIKMAPVINLFKSNGNLFEIKVCVTAQHREMLDQVLDFFSITPDYDLNLMKKDQTLFDITTNVLQGLNLVIEDSSPDYIIVHGDTTTSMAASLAAFYRKIKICHVEAGLRTNNKYSPFPEEINRQLTARLANLHFAPTELAKDNLLRENIKSESVYVTGNTVIDALYLGLKKLETYSNEEITFLNSLIAKDKKIILVTGHRRENFGKGFLDICNALKDIASDPKVQIIYPVHLNPNVQDPVFRILSSQENIDLISPLSYPAFLWLMSKSYLILTDSGGIQEEAPSLGKPVLVLRENTERPEAVEAGTVILVGTNPEKICNETKKLLNNEEAYRSVVQKHNPYGDGKASERILQSLIQSKI